MRGIRIENGSFMFNRQIEIDLTSVKTVKASLIAKREIQSSSFDPDGTSASVFGQAFASSEGGSSSVSVSSFASTGPGGAFATGSVSLSGESFGGSLFTGTSDWPL
jgi:hypothetical protein